MGFPAGMQLATVAFGIPLTVTGKEVVTHVTVKPTSRVIWAATGQPLPEFSDSFTAEAGQLGQFQVPCIDQPGFIDSAGNAVTDFAYQITASWSFGNERPITWAKNLKPLLGQTGPIDLDLVPDGPVSIPVTAPTASVLGFNGRTGFITLQDSDLPSRLSEASLSATYGTPKLDKTEAAAKYGPPTSALQDVLGRIYTGASDANILIISDSTVAQGATTTWGMGLAARLAAQFPTHSIATHWYSDGGVVYNTPSVIAGTGPRTIRLYMGSVSGKDSSYAVTRYSTLITPANADVIIFSHGHNENATDTTRAMRDRYVQNLEMIRTWAPSAAVILMSQNPGSSASAQKSGIRADLYRRIAAERGYGFIDAHMAFLRDGRDINTVLVQGDGLHPTAAGHLVWLDEVMRHFQNTTVGQPTTQTPPSLYTTRRNLLTNGDFTDTSVPGGFAIAGWYGTNVTLSQSTAIKESKTYSYKVAKTAAGASAKLFQTIPPALVAGKDVTVAMRIYIASGQAATAGRIAVVDTVSALMSTSEYRPIYDQWHWKIVTTTVAGASTGMTVNLFVDPNGTANLEEVYVDRIVVTQGRFPNDVY